MIVLIEGDTRMSKIDLTIYSPQELVVLLIKAVLLSKRISGPNKPVKGTTIH